MEKLIIGITGHRDVIEEDTNKLYCIVSDILDKFRSKYEVILLTSLAWGADMVCARAAHALGIKFYVILPTKKEEYLKDFPETEKSLWLDLFAKATGNCIALPKTDNPYYNASYYLVTTSDKILALWNGEERLDLPGGTADTVRLAIEKNKEVTQIVTKRQSSDYLSGQKFEIRIINEVSV